MSDFVQPLVPAGGKKRLFFSARFTPTLGTRKILTKQSLECEEDSAICGKTEELSVSIRVNSLDLIGSVCDGPGLRAVVYLQGCSRKCHGCHNHGTWDPSAGQSISVRDLAEMIRSGAPTHRLTISGGEPLEQVSGLLALVEELPDFDLALYTGHDLEDVPPAILRRLCWVKVGGFDISRRTTVIPFVGSSNQKFLSACDALAAQSVEALE